MPMAGCIGVVRGLQGPGIELEGTIAPCGERGVEYVEGVEGLHAINQVILPKAIESAHGESARIDLGAFLDQRLDLVIDRQVARKALLADRGPTARPGSHQDARPIEDEGDLEALANQPGRGEEVDQADG